MINIRGGKLFGKGILLLIVVLLSGLLITGCGVLDTLLQKDGSTKGTLGDWIGNSTTPNSQPASALPGESLTVSLYFADSSGKYLIKEERTIPKTLSLARETVNQWLRGPAITSNGSSTQKTVSPSTALLEIGIKDGIATVDLSKDFSQPYGKVAQEVTLYGLVNTLAQFSSVKEVHIRLEGKPLQKLGSIDTNKLTYKASLVKASVSQPQATLPANSGESMPVTSNGNSKTPVPSPSSINLFSFPASST